MSMLYRVLRVGLKKGLELYFLDIRAVGQERVPDAGPVIFAANHPNSIMDTVTLGSQTTRQIHYMARSGLFKNPLVAALFNQCGVIPIYRSQDGTDMAKNTEAFSAAYEVLEEGLTLGIFPEGHNSEERRVGEIKTGTARIALGAEARNGFELGVRIVPVGLNFQDRDQFLSGVVVRFGEPIDARDYAEVWARDEREAARELTDAIQSRLRRVVTHIEDDVVRELTESVLAISGRELLEDMDQDEELGALLDAADRAQGEVETSTADGVLGTALARLRPSSRSARALDDTLVAQRYMAEAFEDHIHRETPEIRKLQARIARYEDHLKQVRLRRRFGRRDPSMLSSRKEAIKLTAYALGFGAFAGWGFVHNVAPYQLCKQAALRAPDEAIRAFTAFVVGLFAFPAWYAGIAAALWRLAEWPVWAVAVYLATLPLTGFFFLRYRRRVAGYRDRILVRTLLRTQRNLVRSLLDERARLLEMAMEVLQAYAARQGR
jgi:1-acyl-sn-glycerol-3-phosphate acyltransferase